MAAGVRRRVRGDVHAVDVAILVAHQQRIAVEGGTRLIQLRIECRAHEATAHGDRELPASAAALLAHFQGIDVSRVLGAG